MLPCEDAAQQYLLEIRDKTKQEKRWTSMGHNKYKGTTRRRCVSQYFVSACYFRLRHNLTCVWFGKRAVPEKVPADSKFRKQAAVFDQKSATKQTIAAAGERALVSLYNGEDSETLDMLRQSRFFQKVGSSSKVVGPENIPPTSAAAKYHSFRVYHQVQEWQGRDDMQADEWGWIVKNGTMVGTQTDKPPAPGHLLNVIRCKCKTDCHTTRCSCKKHGLECSAMCGECKGVSCLNSPEVSLSIRDEDYLDT